MSLSFLPASLGRIALDIALGIAWTGSVTSAVYCGLVVRAARRFCRRRRRALAKPPRVTPPVRQLTPLPGAVVYPASFELLFCARHEHDAGLQLARSVAARHPAVTARFLTCGEPQFPNPKMFSLAVMTEAAAYDTLVTSDADARVTPDYLLRCVQELENPEVELASCLYVGLTDDPGLMLRLDALGKSVEMSSGVLVADMLSGTDFALGVTMVLRRRAFAEAGGLADLGNYWAEDFVLGNRLAAQRKGVAMATHVIRLMVTADNVAHSLRNQLRWAQSTRRSRPWGHLGTGLTFAMPFGLLGFAAEAVRQHWPAAALFLLLAGANRMLQAAVVLGALGKQEVWRDVLLYPLRDLLGGIIWLASYSPADTRYHGTQFRIMPDGKLAKPD